MTISHVQIQAYIDEGCVRELYVFKDDKDLTCPTILHFPLTNNLFRTMKAPGKGSKGEGGPLILHFPLINKLFRTMKAPGKGRGRDPLILYFPFTNLFRTMKAPCEICFLSILHRLM